MYYLTTAGAEDHELLLPEMDAITPSFVAFRK
jgi:hypothetical protein